MRIIAVDPGNTKSGYVVLDGSVYPPIIIAKGKIENELLRYQLKQNNEDLLLIEMPACYGMAVGQSVFDTCFWAGRFVDSFGGKFKRIYRKKTSEDGIGGVCMTLCKNNRANDSNVRQALIDLYPGTGGGKTPQIGIKKNPGPLFGVSNDIWAALAVGVTYLEWVKMESEK